jgi:hypothetical protein
MMLAITMVSVARRRDGNEPVAQKAAHDGTAGA